MERPTDDPALSPPEGAVDDGTNEAAPEAGDDAFFARHFRVLLAALVVLAVVGGVGVAYTQHGRIAQATASLPFLGGGEKGQEGMAGAPKEYGSFTEMKGLVVNPAESGGARYLAVSLAFETSAPSVLAELETKEVVVRDAVLDLLSERTVDELSTVARRDALKDELRERTNTLLSSGAVDRLYFTQFVLQ